MLNGYVLGTSKLSEKEFADKYWKGGIEEYVYQFHTMDIDDGIDERQQLLINNDRALFKVVEFYYDRATEQSRDVLSELESGRKKARRNMAVLAAADLAMLLLLFLTTICLIV